MKELEMKEKSVRARARFALLTEWWKTLRRHSARARGRKAGYFLCMRRL